MNNLLKISCFISIITYYFWNEIKKLTGVSVFYIGNALFIFILCLVIWYLARKYLASFVLLCLAFNNFLDELFFDNTKIGLNEYIFAIILIIITYIRYRYARKTNTHN